MTIEQEIIAILKSRFSDTEFLIQLSPMRRGFELRAVKGSRFVVINQSWIIDKLHYFDPTVIDDIIDFGYWIVYGVDVSEAEIVEEIEEPDNSKISDGFVFHLKPGWFTGGFDGFIRV